MARRALRWAAASAGGGAAAAAGYSLTFPYVPHARMLPDGRQTLDWEGTPPRVVQAFNALTRRWQRSLFPLDADGLVAAACRQAGLADFGDEDALPFREGLRRMVAAIDEGGPWKGEGGFSPFMRMSIRVMAIQWLVMRLKVQELVSKHPEILQEEIDAPLFVVGLPRTGTTHLLNMLAEHPALRPLPLWESLDVVRPAGWDHRTLAGDVQTALHQWILPCFDMIHAMSTHEPHEDLQLLCASFASWMIETMVHSPAYGEWYEATDHTSAYRHFKILLQVMQWQDRVADPDAAPRRWVLKTPMHCEQYGPLLRVFPDACVAATHRDPVRVVPSVLTLFAYGALISDPFVTSGTDRPKRIAKYWVPRMERMLRKAVDGRAQVPPGQIVDVHFADFVADNLATCDRVCAAGGVAVTPDSTAAIQKYIDDHPRGKHGTLYYDLAPFGVDEAALRDAYGFYAERLGMQGEKRGRAAKG